MNSIEERARKAYPENHPCDYECREGFRKACEEYESLPKIHGWVARDKSGDLDLYGDIPSRLNGQFIADSGSGRMFLDNDLFPDLTWVDEPREVELLIRKV